MSPQQNDQLAIAAECGEPHPRPPKRFPPAIERALSLLAGSDHGPLSALSMGERLLLARYVRCLDAHDPGAPIRVSIRTLADGLRVSPRTVNNLKASLLANAWITSHQVQSRRQGMQICDVRLTARGVRALQLLEPLRRSEHERNAGPVSGTAVSEGVAEAATPSKVVEVSSRDQGPNSDVTDSAAAGECAACGQLGRPNEPLGFLSQAVRAAHAHAYRDSLEQPLQRHPRGKSLDQKRRHAHAWQYHRTPQLPRPLQWLLGLMTATRVCLLMREASAKGIALEALATASADAIKRARNPFAYLRAMVNRDPNARTSMPQLRPGRTAQASDGLSRLASMEGRAFVGPDGLIQRIESGVIRVYTTDEALKPLGSSLGVMPLTRRLLQGLDAGHLRLWSPAPARSPV